MLRIWIESRFLIMNKSLFGICLFAVFILSYASENVPDRLGNEQTYNLNDLVTNSFNSLQTAHQLKDQYSNPLHDLSLEEIDWKSEIESLLEDSTLNSSKCFADVGFTFRNLKNQWALGLLDSFGKPESGILQGNLKFLGNYKECINVHSTNPNSPVGNFDGKYCLLSMSSGSQAASPFQALSMAICVPDSCSNEQLDSILNISRLAVIIPALNETKVTATCKARERPLNASANGVIALLSIFFFLALLGSSVTVVDYAIKIVKESSEPSLILNVSVSDCGIGDADSIKKDRDDVRLLQGTDSDNSGLHKVKKFLRCFCVFTNGAKLLNTDSSEGQLLCIHGIRFLSMSWVILGHSYVFMISYIKNLLDAASLVDDFAFQVVLQGFYSVDSFFLLSGFLLTYLTMKEFSKTKGVIPWSYFYIHRYIRLTPVYMVVLAFSATVFLYMGSGPFWPDNTIDHNCSEHWWWNLLYINNFNDMQDMCMGWSWYLSNDMQFFVISPLLLITLWRWPKVGYGLIATLLVACWLSNFFITYHFDLMTGLSDAFSKPTANVMDATARYMGYFNKIYTKPYTRISPYLIGMLLGYILFKRRATDRPKHSLLFLSIGWIVASTITLVAVYGLYHNHPALIGASFYNALNRTTFSLGLAWVIYVSLIGQGGPVDKILSYKLFIPLSRLTYVAYLIHPLIITGYYSSLKTTFHFDQPSVVLLFLGFMVTTYALALPVALILESPIVSLEKLLRNSFSKKESS